MLDGVQFVFAGSEIYFGALLTSTGIGAFVGVPMILNGIDDGQAATRRLLGDEEAVSGKYAGSLAVARQFTDEEQAREIATYTDIGGSLVAGGGLIGLTKTGRRVLIGTVTAGAVLHAPEAEGSPVSALLKVARRSKPVSINGGTVRGFSSAGEVSERAGNLANQLRAAGLDDVQVGIRGSAVTNRATRGGPFRLFRSPGGRPSDVDFFIRSAKLESRALREIGPNAFKNGVLRPSALRQLDSQIYDIFDSFKLMTSKQIGRGASARLLQEDLISSLTKSDFIMLR